MSALLKPDTSEIPKLNLLPGEVAVAQSETLITTLLGSCVAVAIHDPMTKISGLNHYLLPQVKGTDTASNRFGDQAISQLLKSLQKAGADMDQLQAKIFGGAHVNPGNSIGEKIAQANIQIAEESLKALHIPIFRKDVGGTKGRRIYLNTLTLEVIVKYNQK